jgi:hypothetical protein
MKESKKKGEKNITKTLKMEPRTTYLSETFVIAKIAGEHKANKRNMTPKKIGKEKVPFEKGEPTDIIDFKKKY